MPGIVDSGALLIGVAAFAVWTLARSSQTRRMGWVNWLGGVGILALFFSITSPDDDAFQQELITPTSSALVCSQTRLAQRGSLADLSIDAVAAAGDSIRALRADRSVVVDHPLSRLTHVKAPISIHSPPIAS